MRPVDGPAWPRGRRCASAASSSWRCLLRYCAVASVRVLDASVLIPAGRYLSFIADCPVIYWVYSGDRVADALAALWAVEFER